MRRYLILAAALAMLSVPAAAQERLLISSFTPHTSIDFLHHTGPAQQIVGELYVPAGARPPMPLVVLKHGSGGMCCSGGANIRSWAKTLGDWGIASLAVDSFTPRGIAITATDQSQLSVWADVADSFAALKLIAADPRIDKSRIGIMGWSRGGTVAMYAALDEVRRPIVGDDLKFAAHIVLYGPASTQYRGSATDRSPMLVLHGAADDYVSAATTREYADWFQSMGNPVTFVAYPGLYHDFDVVGGYDGFSKRLQVGAYCHFITDMTNGHVFRLGDEANPARSSPADIRAYFSGCIRSGAHLAFNAAARSDAVNRVHAFLVRYFRIAG